MNLEETKNFIVKWIKRYAQDNSIETLTVGISGGIDSALTSKLCALTEIKTIVVSMPIHQKELELKNANLHINLLTKEHKNVQKEYIDLSSLFENYKTDTKSFYSLNFCG